MSTQTAEAAFIALIRRLRDDENAARRHRRIRYEGGQTLADFFDESLRGNQDLALMLNTLKTQTSVRSDTEGMKLVIAGKPDESLLMSIITPGSDFEIRSMSSSFADEDRTVVRQWIESLPVEDLSPIDAPGEQTK